MKIITLLFQITLGTSSLALLAQQHTGTAPKWSADGKQIVYVDGKWPEGREIWIMNADGTQARQLTSNKYADEYPSLSPDGTTILFSSNRTGTWKLFSMDINGANQRDLGLESTATDENDPCLADWSPDGKQFCFPWTQNGVRQLYIANLDGTGVRPIPNGQGMYPDWSRDGQSITFYYKGNIHIINTDGTHRKTLTNNTDPASVSQRAIYPQWSADGHSIFFIRGDHIFRINPDGTDEKQITDTPGQKWYLSVSNHDQLIYTTLEKKDAGVLDRLYVANADGSGLKML